MSKLFYTDYRTAAHRLNNQLILCNNITELDFSVIENMHLDNVDTEYYEEAYGSPYPEIYQWYLTSLSDDDVEWMEKTFNLIFSYSDMLDLWVLCVDHWGTAWDYVPCKVKDEEWAKYHPELEYKH